MLHLIAPLLRRCLTPLCLFATAGLLHAQDLEPRRWTHLPTGSSVAGLSYIYTDGQLLFDPATELEDVSYRMQTFVASYAHWFKLSDYTGRVDLILPYQEGHWEGLLSGSPAMTDRSGFGDPWVRLTVNLVGSPPLEGKEYMKFRAANPTNTVVGVGLGVRLPLGEYSSDQFINLGQNRFVFRPQAGVVHTRGPWSYELTGSAFLYADNDDFFGGTTLSQDPKLALQAHFIRTIGKRWWGSLSVGHSWAGESKVDGMGLNDGRSYWLTGLSVGFAVSKRQSLKAVLFNGDTKVDYGSDSTSVVLAWSMGF